MFSVSQVLSSGFARSWHEAVAIVQEAASQVQPGLGLPGADDLMIDEAGVLTLGFGDEGSDDPVAALAGLLGGLLEGVEAPQALRDLASENDGPSPSHASVASFSQALAFYERPNRANDIRAVAGRLRHFREKSDTETEFDRLREKVAHAPEPKAPEKKKKREKRKVPKLSKAQQAAAVAAVSLMVFGTLGYRSGLHQNLSSVTGGVESGIQGVLSSALEWFGISKASASSAEAREEPVEAERETPDGSPDRPMRASRSGSADRASRPVPREAAGSSKTSAADAATPLGAPKPSPPTAETLPAARATAPPAAPPAPMPAVTGMPEPGAVFTEDHPEVQAPVLVRPQLPKEPAPGDDTGIFEILVDEHGDVAQVKLISPRRRFHDRMLVAAAKAWKFRPATLHGQPVRYRIQIPIILKGMP